MAIQAFLPVLQDLYPWQLAFGIGTPAAAQRAALDEYGGADARTVIDRIFLDIEDHSRLGHIRNIRLFMIQVNIQMVYNMYIISIKS